MKKTALTVCAMVLVGASSSAAELECLKFFSGNYLKHPNADVTVTISDDGDSYYRYVVPAGDNVVDEILSAVEHDGQKTSEKTVRYSKGKLVQQIVTFSGKSGKEKRDTTIVYSPGADGKSVSLSVSIAK